ncbi:MAG TPA: DUF2508 family protein [Syntrophomonadaceae bacterium]|nr:DUF2508 family protein [Syntrophomonadaceae bacterium]
MQIKALMNRVGTWLTFSPPREEETVSNFSQDRMLEEAHRALVQAQNLFSRVEDPDMIQYAVYTMKAAEEHYNYLIKAMKASRQEKACL